MRPSSWGPQLHLVKGRLALLGLAWSLVLVFKRVELAVWLHSECNCPRGDLLPIRLLWDSCFGVQVCLLLPTLDVEPILCPVHLNARLQSHPLHFLIQGHIPCIFNGKFHL